MSGSGGDTFGYAGFQLHQSANAAICCSPRLDQGLSSLLPQAKPTCVRSTRNSAPSPLQPTSVILNEKVNMDHQLMFNASAAELRIAEAEYFLSQFLKYSGPPVDVYFKMVCYFDAFLFSLISVEDMVSADEKKQLHALGEFRFLKTLRNISAHNSVIAVMYGNNNRPLPRMVTATVGGPQNDTARIFINFQNFHQMFDEVERNKPQFKGNVQAARKELLKIENENIEYVFFDDVMRKGLDAARSVLNIAQ
ncbi:MAG: hypothetical protein K2X09_05680 [Rickettsiales bacterium]|nr:hypothetical protein [Rickettsiales bacterium]